MDRSLRWILLPLLAAIFIVSCSPSVVGTPVTDEEYEAAIQQARETMDVLLRSLLAPNPTNRFVGVKARFHGKDVSFEDHWTEPVEYYNNVFTVRLLDGLTVNNGLHAEHLAEVRAEDILDWVIVESDGHVLGGYTLRLDYERMSPEEQKKYRENTGYRFD